MSEPASHSETLANAPVSLRTLGVVAAVSLLLMATSYLLLNRLRAGQKLGAPAVAAVAGITPPTTNVVVRTNAVLLPESATGYASEWAPIEEVELVALPPDTAFGRRLYRASADDFVVQANVVLMGSDRTSIHQPDFCLKGVGWDIQRKRTVMVSLNGSSELLEVCRFDATKTITVPGVGPVTRSGVYVFWFVADGHQTASHTGRTLLTMRSLLTDNTLPRWAYLSFFAQCPPGEEEQTFTRMTGLIAELAPQMQKRTAPGIAAAERMP